MPAQQQPGREQPQRRDGEGSLVRSGLIVSAMTMLSRVLGLVREVVFAAIFGDGPQADAFFVAFRIPNFLRRLFAEGAFAQAFVPVLSEYRKTRTREEVKALIDHVGGCLGLALLLVTIVGVLAAPLLAMLFAPGYLDAPDKFALLVDMLRVTFPYILLISLTGFAGAILNSYGRFAVPALTPVLLNLCLIGAALLVSPLLDEPVMALAWGVLLAGLIQLMFQLPFLGHLRLLPRPRFNPRYEGVKKVITLMLPVMFSVSVSQLNLLLDTVLATTQASGSVSWLYYADRLLELPLGVFGIAIATVILPSLSRIFAEQNEAGFAETLEWGLRVILVMGLPATLALAVLAEPLVFTLYQRGEFGVDSVAPTADALRAYSLGLLAFMTIKVLASAYFSRQDTRGPVRCGVIAMVANMGLNLLLILPLAHVGLALATSLSAYLNAGLLFAGLLGAGVLRFRREWLLFLAQVSLAGGAMALLLWLMLPAGTRWGSWSTWERILQLAWLCLVGGGAYALALLVVGIRPRHFRH